KKDYQQLMVVRGMVRQLDLPVEIVAGETARERDGLAMSSRNNYLSAAERAEAPRLYRTLLEVKAGNLSGEKAVAALAAAGWKPASRPLEEMKALAAASVFQVTTGSGLIPGTWRQIGKPSDL